MEQQIPEETLNRIRQMEACLDTLLAAAEQRPAAIREEPELLKLLGLLTEYYDGGQWLQDFALDETGLLPPELKRGVLSEDAVYNFLAGLEVPADGNPNNMDG